MEKLPNFVEYQPIYEEIYLGKVNEEKEIKDAKTFREWAEYKLKKMHGENYDEKLGNKVIDALIKKAEESGDWGAAVGMLNKA